MFSSPSSVQPLLHLIGQPVTDFKDARNPLSVRGPDDEKGEVTVSDKLRIFVSSVQNELQLERTAITQLVFGDSFLNDHCEAVLYEKEPSTGRPSTKGYLDTLNSCEIYLLLLDKEYGNSVGAGGLSATHEEYRRAQSRELPTLVFIRGKKEEYDKLRKPGTQNFIEEIDRDGYTYVRFHDREDLKPLVSRSLHNALEKSFQIVASQDELNASDLQMEKASGFESQLVTDLDVEDLDETALGAFTEIVIPDPSARIYPGVDRHALGQRGLAQIPPGAATILTRAAYLLFSPQPSDRFPQCEILADAYDEQKISGHPKGQITINAPLVSAVEQALAFIDQHTFHPHRVVGLKNLRLDEYPTRALREALINAVAHRNYEDTGRKILLRVFSDRIELSSPGYPLKPLTLTKLRKGTYHPCSRNPLIAQTLTALKMMEQRGTGFVRMRDAMLNHGLKAPVYDQKDGYFVVTFRGPAGKYDRLKASVDAIGPVTPAIESRLSDRQKKMVALLVAGEELTSRDCQQRFRVSAQALHRDFRKIVALDLATAVGSGRNVRYVFQSRD